jgi:Tfp pilus assembly protein PilO
MKSLTAQQQRTLMYLISTVLALALSAGMLVDLRSKNTEATKLRQEIERKERDAQNAQPPSLEEQRKWAEDENQLKNVLLNDQAVSQFMEEVTRIANENGLDRLGLNTDETIIDANKTPSPEETKLLGVGVRRYLVVTIKFQGQYPDVARFLGGISKLQRPIEYHMIDMRRSQPLVDVTVVMNVYKREAA